MDATIATRNMTSTATVTPLVGTGARGPVYGQPVEVPCWPEQSSKLVRDSEGSETTSSTRLWCEAEHEALFTAGATVTFRGVPAEVITVAVHDPGAIALPRLLEVSLQ